MTLLLQLATIQDNSILAHSIRAMASRADANEEAIKREIRDMAADNRPMIESVIGTQLLNQILTN